MRSLGQGWPGFQSLSGGNCHLRVDFTRGEPRVRKSAAAAGGEQARFNLVAKVAEHAERSAVQRSAVEGCEAGSRRGPHPSTACSESATRVAATAALRLGRDVCPRPETRPAEARWL